MKKEILLLVIASVFLLSRFYTESSDQEIVAAWALFFIAVIYAGYKTLNDEGVCYE